MAADPNPNPTTLSGDPVVQEAKKRFDRCVEWESVARTRYLDDVKFAHGDADNGYQWPSAIRRSRDIDKRPCLTMNVVRQHNLQIVNESRQNKSAIAVRATGGGASKASADVFAAVIRRIEYQSDAQSAYLTGQKCQVDGGIGWWRIYTDYSDDKTFDQEAFIGRIWDPLCVYMDPDCQKEDCSDANFAFVFDEVAEYDFLETYPKYKDQAGLQPMGVSTSDDGVMGKDKVRIVEYFRRVKTPGKLVSFIDPNDGVRKQLKKSEMPKEIYDALLREPLTKVRDIQEEKIEWKLIAGEKVIDETDWPGKYIPLIRVLGEETIIEGTLDRKGHTRAMKDAQRMYNYNASSQVEFVALQSKTPWVAAAKAIEEYETMWNTANQINHSVLIYNDTDDSNPDRTIAPPVRTPPPTFAPGFETGMETSFNQMMMTSGQWQNQMGMGGNERTGEAIEQRKMQSDTSVFHFQDNYAAALRYTGKQLIDLIPKIYDTRRVLRCSTEAGEDFEVEIDPSARQALMQQMAQDGMVVRRIFNPQVGQYDVEADVGAAYGTKRQETVSAMTLLLTQSPGLAGLIGDLLLQAMDFKEATEAAQRLKRMVPPQALGIGPSQQEQALTQQVGQLQNVVAKLLDQNAKEKLRLVGKGEMRDIDVYKAQTDRFAALKDALPMDQAGLETTIRQLVEEAMQTNLEPIIKANSTDGGNPDLGGISMPEVPPHPAAQKAPDGNWYLRDPTRRGKFLLIAPLAQERQPPKP